MNKHLIAIVGPTGIGKTALSIACANAFKTQIISCDSRQFYKEMTIGTAVPNQEELAAAPHHFIQHLSIHEHLTAGQFEKEALNQLDIIYETHDVAIIVGGSMLFMDALLYGLDDLPRGNQALRDQLKNELENQGLKHLQERLKAVDPEYYSQADIQNSRRVIRALEVYEVSGEKYSSLRKQNHKNRPFNTHLIGLNGNRQSIYDRINHRVDLMMDAGLLDEVRSLLPYRDLQTLNTVGYKELFIYLDTGYTLKEAVDEIKKNTRRFAKRQLTWYAKNEHVQWFDYSTPHETIIHRIKNTIIS